MSEFKFTHKNKQELTQQLFEMLPSVWTSLVPEEFWHNLKLTGGYRLSDRGVKVLVNILNLPHHLIEVKTDFTRPRFLLDLDKNLEIPYYVLLKGTRMTHIALFRDREATLALLYDDIEKFVAALPRRQP